MPFSTANVDSPDILTALCRLLIAVSERIPLVFPVHPRTRKNLVAFGLLDGLQFLSITNYPFPFPSPSLPRFPLPLHKFIESYQFFPSDACLCAFLSLVLRQQF
jgi:hypothetical protein